MEPTTPAAPEPAADVESQEWEAAENERYDTPEVEEQPTEEEPAAEEEPTEEEEPAAEEEPAEDEEVPKSDSSARAVRAAAREAARMQESMRTQVYEQMFADAPQTLQDADGDPIEKIEDVTALINPRTGENFTEEEAGMWLLSAQQQFNKTKAETEKQVDAIVDTLMDLNDQADAVNEKYGEWLKNNPDKRDQLWSEFEKTLVKDEKSGIITKTSMSLEGFYDLYFDGRDLTPAEAAAGTPEQGEAPAPAETPEQVAARKQQARADRSDIYAPTNTPVTDPEEDDWDVAEKEVFGSRLK